MELSFYKVEGYGIPKKCAEAIWEYSQGMYVYMQGCMYKYDVEYFSRDGSSKRSDISIFP